MNIKLKYFGEIAEIAKCFEEEINQNEKSLSSLLQYIQNKYKLDSDYLIIAVNQKQVENIDSIFLKENDEVALLPPFAGG